MYWTKVTDALPPEGERCFLTTVNPDGSRTTDIATWLGDKCGWKFLSLGFHPTSLADDETRFTITHWMPIPAPAEDEEAALDASGKEG